MSQGQWDDNRMPPPPAGSYQGETISGGAKPSQGLAIASLVCGLVGLLVLPVVLGPLAIIFGAIAPKRPDGGRQGMAIAGIVLGIVDVVIFIIVLIAAGSAISNFG